MGPTYVWVTRHRCRVQHVIFAKGSSLASYRFFLCAVAIILNTMDETVLNDLQKLKLTKEEGEEICITSTNQSNLLEECSLSLFGKLLSGRHQNNRALKNTLRMAWKLGSDLRIVDVGNVILQFKFSSRFQMDGSKRVAHGISKTISSFYVAGKPVLSRQTLSLLTFLSEFKSGAFLLSSWMRR